MGRRTPPPARAGAALILAIALLAALLLMGLPFLFIQSASVGGARSLAAQQQARQTAEGLAVYAQALGIQAVQGHLGPATAAWSSLPLTASALGLGASSAGTTIPNRLDLVVASATSAATGLWIEDEQGKLDANRLGPMGWSRLFALLSIIDWDDSEVDESVRIAQGYYWTRTVPPPDTNIGRNDSSPAGQLADALCRVRSQRGGFAKLEDLLLADPNDNPGAEWKPTSAIFRKPLTPGELEKLRPHLTFRALSQARAGLIDNGTVTMVHPTWQNLQVSDGQAYGLDDWMVTTVAGTTLEFYGRGTPGSVDLHAVHSSTASFTVGDARLLGVPASINLHQATAVVRAWLHPNLASWDGTAVLSHGGMAASWPLSLPQRGNIAYPQVDTVSLGWFTLDARAQVADRQGQVLARSSTRRTVQAVPQEGLVERAWLSQGDLEHIARSGAFSRIATWPHPVNRLSDTSGRGLPKDGDRGATTFPDAGFTAAPFPLAPLHTPDWTAYLGAFAPAPAATVANASTGAVPMATSGGAATAASEALRPDGLDVGPAGWQLAYRAQDDGPLKPFSASEPEMAGRTLEFWVRPDQALTGIVPLLDLRAHPDRLGRPLDLTTGTWAAANDPASLDRQNHLGLYYDAGQEMLVLVHAPPSVERSATAGAIVNADNPLTPFLDERCLSTAGYNLILPQLAPRPSTAPVEWAARLFTPLWQPNRILHCYATPGGLVTGQWYRIQVVLAGGRPGQQTLLVDGCAGRQANRISASDAGYAVRWGDQVTLPTLVLDEDLAAIDASQGATISATSTYRPTLRVALPAMVAAKAPALTVADLIPRRGCLLIDDEHIRYEDIAPGATAGATLNSITRGVRQDSVISIAEPTYRWRPGSQAHARRTPMLGDGWRSAPASIDGRLFSGSSTLRSPAAAAAPTVLGHGYEAEIPTSGHRGSIRAVLDPDGNATDDPPRDITAATITMTSLWPAAEWPIRGVVYISTMGYFGFVRDLAQPNDFRFFVLTPTKVCPSGINAALATPLTNSFDPDNGFTCYLASAEIDAGTNPAEQGAFTSDDMAGLIRLVQVSGPRHSEWLSYWAVMSQDSFPLPPSLGGGTDRAAFLVFEVGIRSGNRAQARSPWAGHPDCLSLGLQPFEHGATVVPVQNRHGLGHAAQAGDLLTILPRNSSSSVRPLALPIRQVAEDGYLAPAATTLPASTDPLFTGRCDTFNGEFAFDRGLSSHPDWATWTAIPGLFNGTKAIRSSACSFFQGTSWSSPDDLSPTSTSTLATSSLPRLDLLHQAGTLPSGPGPAVAGEGGLFIGSTDPTRPGDGAVTLTQGALTADAIATRTWPDHVNGNNASGAATVLRLIRGSTVVNALLAADSMLSGGGFFVVTTTPIRGATTEDTGLMQIDGEVFAWIEPTAAELLTVQTAFDADPASSNDKTFAAAGRVFKLVGRGLLGSERRDHSVGPNAPPVGDNRGHRPGLWATMLPCGPVGLLIAAPIPAASSAGEWWELGNGKVQGDWTAGVPHRWTVFPEGFALVTKAEPDATDLPELVLADRNPWSPMDSSGSVINPNYERYMPAAWLRGLYRTTRQDWSARIAQGVLLIPWRPRYPSALPRDNPAGNDGLTATRIWDGAMRSRAFSWAGFALRLHDLRFETSGAATITTSGDARLSAIDGAASGIIDAELFFLARRLGGSPDPLIASWPASGSTALANPAVFASYGRTMPTDGGELRLAWRYRRTLADLAPATQADLLRDLAQGANRTPAIATVRLRGYAPCTTLAVEEAR